MGNRLGRLGVGDYDKVNVALAQRGGISWADSEEREHELRAALFGIEASAEVLSRHRELLTDRQFDELTQGLAEEVRRLRAMLEGRSGAPSKFDLGEAIGPVLACARASGLDVSSSVPQGIFVEGRRDSTAQVVLALLDNARHHAASSPVEMRASVLCGAAALYVEDRGRGVSGLSPLRVFERSARGDESQGSGLGLFIARRLMVEQGGSIAVRSRPGGGASFVLRFRRALSSPSLSPRGANIRSVTAR